MDVTVSRQRLAGEAPDSPLAMTCSLPPEGTLPQLFRILIDQGYFPDGGQGGVWVLFCCGQDLAAWNTLTGGLEDRFPFGAPALREVPAWRSKPVEFTWVPSPLERARAIFRAFDGKFSFMGHEGFYREYKSYGISPALEAEWRKELG